MPMAMSADLGKTLEKFVTELVATGRYHSKSEVLREGVRLIQERETRLAALDALAGELVKLRYFAGLALDQAAAALGVSTATAYRHWAYARAWLRDELLNDR